MSEQGEKTASPPRGTDGSVVGTSVAARSALGLAAVLDRGVELIGRATAWLCLLLVAMVAFDVVARYFFRVSWVSQQEFQWHLLAVIALVGASYTLQQREHVSVDILSQHYSERARLWLDLLIPLLIVVPAGVFIALVSLRFVFMSWSIGEGSPDPGGLPARWLLKAFVPLGFALVAAQGVAMTLRAAVRLREER
jgi:TRAP-type mannitol/chloroaromatic compound transport system permease small subunit